MTGIGRLLAQSRRQVPRRAALGGLLGATGLALAACGTTATTGKQNGQPVTIEVLTGEMAGKFGMVGPDGKGHDSWVPAHFTVQAGVPVNVKVLNYDEGTHTFTIDELKLNQVIAARISEDKPSTTSFTFTAPKAGTYRFHCDLSCDGGQDHWAMTDDRNGHGESQDGFMAGYVTAF